MSVTDRREFNQALWGRLRWVLSFSAMLLISAAAVLALVWRDHRASQHRSRTQMAEAVRIQHARMSELAARSPAVLYTLVASGSDYVPSNLSSNIERILGYTLAEAFDRQWFSSHLFPGDAAAALAAPAALATADEVTNEFRFICKDGRVLWLANQMSVTRREGGVPVEITGAWHDITARRAAEVALRESEERLRLALSSAQQGLFDVNVQTGDAIVSPEYATMLGYDPADFKETHAAWRERLHPDDRERCVGIFRDCAEGRRESYSSEYRQRTRSGDWRWVLSNGRIISRSADGRPLRMLGIHTDITAQKTAELRAESLLKELHHRVKNNLQVISSLLRLERDRHTDAAVKSAMAEMQLRILSMALLHERLYQSNDLARVDLGVYLTDLAHQVFRSAAPSTGAITLSTNLASVFVDMDQAIPSGLLVNEVLSNCLKHAFPGGRTGTVTLDLTPAPGVSRYVLRISDTGVGLPADFEARQLTSLGMHLINALATQLKATLTIDPGPGASFTIAFSTADPAATQEPS
jgi:PAS domain S-box-containing protein